MRPALLRGAGIHIALSALIACGLLGCGGGLGAAGTFSPVHAGTLTVATAQIPNPGLWEGTPQHATGGFEYGLAHALAERFGLARVKLVHVPFGRLIAGDLGGADLALSDITVTDERSEHIDFSTSYLRAPPAVLVRPGTSVPDVQAAEGLRWAVQRGTTLQSALEESIRPYEAAQVLEHQREVLLALRVRRADAVMLDLPVALAYARASPRTYEVAAQLPSDDVLAAALPKGSANVEAVDSAIHALTADGTIEKLGRTWLDTGLEEGQAEEVPELRVDG